MSKSLILMMLLVPSMILCGCSASHASSSSRAQMGSVAGTGSATTQVNATTQVAQKETSWEAAVQTVLNYYGDINQKKY